MEVLYKEENKDYTEMHRELQKLASLRACAVHRRKDLVQLSVSAKVSLRRRCEKNIVPLCAPKIRQICQIRSICVLLISLNHNNQCTIL